jgi:hypothetical protein
MSTTAEQIRSNTRYHDNRRAGFSSEKIRSATRSFSLDSLERREMLAFTAHVNFQPSGASTPSGYIADLGKTFANQGNGYTYGWSADNTTSGRDRNSSMSSDQRYDTLRHMAKGVNWQMSVPNGTYKVTLVAGDPSYTDSVYQFKVEDQTFLSGTPSSSKHWITGTATVTVKDGKLTISNGSTALNNKVCFIDISSTETQTTPPPSTGGSSGPSGSDSSLGVKGLVIGDGYDPNKVIPILKDVGAKSIRLWTSVGSWSSRWVNPVFNKAVQYHNAGIKVILLTTSTAVPTYDQAKSYYQWELNQPGLKNAVDYWEIQNEPDLSKYYSGNTNLAGYVKNELRAAWDVFHAAGEKVIGGAPIFTDSAKAMIAAGYNNYCDFAGFHFYGGTPSTIINKIKQVHGIFGSKPLVCTEWSMQFLKVSASEWANDIAQVMPVMKANTVFSQYFNLFVKTGTDSTGGLVFYDYTKNTPIYNEFKSWT